MGAECDVLRQYDVSVRELRISNYELRSIDLPGIYGAPAPYYSLRGAGAPRPQENYLFVVADLSVGHW